jgi:hypothetical protein
MVQRIKSDAYVPAVFHVRIQRISSGITLMNGPTFKALKKFQSYNTTRSYTYCGIHIVIKECRHCTDYRSIVAVARYV